ncbi:21972_t:CDS:1, partial [Racocetra persica]
STQTENFSNTIAIQTESTINTVATQTEIIRDIHFLAKGGFATIFKAICKEGNGIQKQDNYKELVNNGLF